VRVSHAAYLAIEHDIAGAGIDVVQNVTGMSDDQPGAAPAPHGVVFLQQLVDQLADEGNILQVNPGFGLV